MTPRRTSFCSKVASATREGRSWVVSGRSPSTALQNALALLGTTVLASWIAYDESFKAQNSRVILRGEIEIADRPKFSEEAMREGDDRQPALRDTMRQGFDQIAILTASSATLAEPVGQPRQENA